MEDLDLSPEDGDDEDIETEAPKAGDLPPEARKHMERQSRRIEKLQRELADSRLAVYPDHVRNIVSASGLPPAKWAEFAETVKAQLPEQEPAQTDQETDAPAVQAPSEVEQKLAAVTQGPGVGAEATRDYSLDDIRDIGMRDPAEAARILAQKVDPNARPGAPLSN